MNESENPKSGLSRRDLLKSAAAPSHFGRVWAGIPTSKPFTQFFSTNPPKNLAKSVISPWTLAFSKAAI